MSEEKPPPVLFIYVVTAVSIFIAMNVAFHLPKAKPESVCFVSMDYVWPFGWPSDHIVCIAAQKQPVTDAAVAGHSE